MSCRKRNKGPVCPNCGTSLQKEFEFCPRCGQENHDLRVPFKTFLYEFVENLTHFDTKLWNTLKVIFTKPGQLTKDFVEGRRARYVHPARFYVFTSVVFFALLTFWLDHEVESTTLEAAPEEAIRTADLNEFIPDSFLIVPGAEATDLNALDLELPFRSPHYRIVSDRLRPAPPTVLDSLLEPFHEDTSVGYRAHLARALAQLPHADSVTVGRYSAMVNGVEMSFTDRSQEALFRKGDMSEEEVDAMLGLERDSVTWFEKRVIRSLGRLDFRTADGIKRFGHAVIKAVSIIMFILMPFTAVLLLWIFFRKRFYWEHLIFSVHTHTTFFLFFCVLLSIALMIPSTWPDPVVLLIAVACFAYLLAALHRVYGKGWTTTIFRFGVMSVPYMVVFLLLMLVGVLWGFFTV